MKFSQNGKKEEKQFKLAYFLLFALLILFLFYSIHQLVKPAIWKAFDLSKSGQIGDTIGGITAPIINIFGAILVFLSFRVQTLANKNQQENLTNQIESQSQDRNFQIGLDLIKELKADVNELEYTDLKDSGALRRYVKQLTRKSTMGIESYANGTFHKKWEFIIAQLYLTLIHVKSSDIRENERANLQSLCYWYYLSNLYEQNNNMITILEHTDLSITSRNQIQEIEIMLGISE